VPKFLPLVDTAKVGKGEATAFHQGGPSRHRGVELHQRLGPVAHPKQGALAGVTLPGALKHSCLGAGSAFGGGVRLQGEPS
jgi:hypothetical protein